MQDGLQELVVVYQFARIILCTWHLPVCRKSVCPLMTSLRWSLFQIVSTTEASSALIAIRFI